jgi:asparagine synthase (glutamine-hydrolysing)
VALMQCQSDIPIRTFSIGFHEQAYDETPYARAVAKHLHTDHTELYVTPQEAMNVVPRLPAIFDEPFADSSQIPTFLVSELTRRHVSVALSGDGGDEMFAGYRSYGTNSRFRSRYAQLPGGARRMAAWALTRLSPDSWDRIFADWSFAIPSRMRRSSPGERLDRLAFALRQTTDAGLHAVLMSAWVHPEQVVCGAVEPQEAFFAATPKGCTFIESMTYSDLGRYLPDDVLTKVDRASMAVALEARSPLLDYRIAEFAWRVPLAMKVSETESKVLLRNVLYRYVPREIMERPKVGFEAPIAVWLRGPLRAWAEELLAPDRMRRQGLLNPGPIQRLWAQHQKSEADWSAQIWTVLMFQAWKQQWHPDS